MATAKFHEIFKKEVDAINVRRMDKRASIILEQEDVERDGTPIMRPTPSANVIGLALSGGGIRSSAFCLGVLQALDARGFIDKIDYLSTVSGGGYIGTSMTAAMSENPEGNFPFKSELREGEVPGVQHIRDHSNYLFPQGLLNIFSNVAVYLRGLMANAVLLLPALLFAAAFTIWSNPNVNALTQTNLGGYFVHLPIAVRHFGLTLNGLLALVALLALWALWRSTPKGRNLSDVAFGARVFGVLLVVVLVISFFELQPLLLYGMFKAVDASGGTGALLASASTWLKGVAALLAPIGAVVGFFGRFLGDALKQASEKPGSLALVTRIAIKLAMYVAGAAVPVSLWVAYLYLSFWGIRDCAAISKCTEHTPAWLATVAHPAHGSLLTLYLVVGFVLLVIGWLLSPNSNSLHRLYRDRLSKAFLFDPAQRMAAGAWSQLKGEAGQESDEALRNSDLQPLGDLKVSHLTCHRAPYHLINTALNIEASKYANRRGRNADFFIFSPLYVGSEATGYVPTTEMEYAMPGLTAGSAMAISGAAASSNMGSATIKPLVPTLAILNIRLGYWLPNPAKVAKSLKTSVVRQLFDKLYFLNELLGLLREDSETIYLTDGGHIENLGIYELLRRRCKLIIAVDAEADPEMSFGSLVTLERYARIDLSTRIDLPWADVRDATRKASAEILQSGGLAFGRAAHGPHCALGTVYYPRKKGDSDDDCTGLLLYIKSSISGDENDYVLDYKRRNGSFPHETTLDQLFTEEQFEVYRSLGFHALHSAFKGVDQVAMRPSSSAWQGAGTKLVLEQRLRSILG